MSITINQIGRVVIPKAIRDHLHLVSDREIEIEIEIDVYGNEICLRIANLEPSLIKKRGLLIHHGTKQSDLDITDFLRTERENRSTSIIVAAVVDQLPQHTRAAVVFANFYESDHEGICSTHCLAECYSTLPALPLPRRMRHCKSSRKISQKNLTIIDLKLPLYLKTLKRVSQLGLRSGVIYDALRRIRELRSTQHLQPPRLQKTESRRPYLGFSLEQSPQHRDHLPPRRRHG